MLQIEFSNVVEMYVFTRFISRSFLLRENFHSKQRGEKNLKILNDRRGFKGKREM